MNLRLAGKTLKNNIFSYESRNSIYLLAPSVSSDKIQQLWSVEIGPGYNGPTVAEGRVFIRSDEQLVCVQINNP